MSGLAGRLMRVYGDLEAMGALYDEGIVLRLPRSLGASAGPHCGKAAVLAFNERTWTFVYHQQFRVEILDDIEQGDVSACRFLFEAVFRKNNAPYLGEYTMFARSRNGLITELDEGLDPLLIQQVRGPA